MRYVAAVLLALLAAACCFQVARNVPRLEPRTCPVGTTPTPTPTNAQD